MGGSVLSLSSAFFYGADFTFKQTISFVRNSPLVKLPWNPQADKPLFP